MSSSMTPLKIVAGLAIAAAVVLGIMCMLNKNKKDNQNVGAAACSGAGCASSPKTAMMPGSRIPPGTPMPRVASNIVNGPPQAIQQKSIPSMISDGSNAGVTLQSLRPKTVAQIQTPDALQQIINDDAFVMIKRPGCGWCDRAMPQFDTAAQELARLAPSIAVAAVDSAVVGNNINGFQLAAVPTFLRVRKGQVIGEKKGYMDKDGILAFARQY